MDYFFYVLRRGEQTILVDVGFDPVVGERRGRTVLHPPVDALRELGVAPMSVAQIVVDAPPLRPHRQSPLLPACGAPPARARARLLVRAGRRAPRACRSDRAGGARLRRLRTPGRSGAAAPRLGHDRRGRRDCPRRRALARPAGARRQRAQRSGAARLGRGALLRGARTRLAVRDRRRPRGDGGRVPDGTTARGRAWRRRRRGARPAGLRALSGPRRRRGGLGLRLS